MPKPSEGASAAQKRAPEPEAEDEVTLPPSAPVSVFVEEAGEKRYITLNFRNTDIRTVINTFTGFLGINYMLTPEISGDITIQSYRKFPMKELLNVFQNILEINGMVAIKIGSSYKIVPLDAGRQQPVESEKLGGSRFRLNSSLITQIVPLQHATANDIANVLRNVIPKDINLIVYEPANILIATSTPASLVKFMNLVEALDVREVKAVKTFVYHVKYGEAKKLAVILRDIYPAETIASFGAPSSPRPRNPVTSVVPEFSHEAQSVNGLTGEEGGITVTAYTDINALLIKCSPKAYAALLDVFRQIDIPVRQVVIEVLIAEITLTDSTDFGIQWLLESGATKAGFTTSSIHKTGFASEDPLLQTLVAGTIDKTYLEGFLTALAAESRLNVLASPQILTLDNQEAEIKIGNEIPTATGLTQQPAEGGGTTLVSSGQIQYRSIGTILQVIPHIVEMDSVNMKLVVEQSGLGDDVTLGSGTFPSFLSRRATTSAVVLSGRTLFLGGLISNERDASRRGIPGLSKIPVLGYLFGTTSDSVTKRELLVMVTPRVIGDQIEAEEMTKDFQNRVRTIKTRLDELDAREGNVFLPIRKGNPVS